VTIKHPPRIYWDACAWISYINKEMPAPGKTFTESRYEMCRETLRRAADGQIEIVTSAFTLAEVCKRVSNDTAPGVNLPAFFDQPYILTVPVDKLVGTRAQNLQLAGVGKLKPPDAVHLASALVHDVPVFHTFDRPLIDLDKLLSMADGNQLKICWPTREVPLPGLLQAMQDDTAKKG